MNMQPMMTMACDGLGCGGVLGPAQQTVFGHTWQDCEEKAASLGWRLNTAAQLCLCPSCIAAGRQHGSIH